MAVNIFSKKTDGAKQLSANFKVSEFACQDGSDRVYIDDALIQQLQKIRDHFGAPITINSGYRTAAHNKKVGGSPNSQHLDGKAADIVVKGIAPLTVARYAETLGVPGIGYYPVGQGNFTHIDTRAGKSYWRKENGREIAVSSFGAYSFALQVQLAAGLEEQTMVYLKQHKYPDALMYKLAEAIYKKAAKGIGGDSGKQVQLAAGLDDNTMTYLRQYKYGAALLDKLAGAMK